MGGIVTPAPNQQSVLVPTVAVSSASSMAKWGLLRLRSAALACPRRSGCGSLLLLSPLRGWCYGFCITLSDSKCRGTTDCS